ncbi:hypothetical protein [Streptomyces sp. H27-D2]|uniref:hypothetical protein n=1 Tax=Streptomyces sp. H27-D2 TaxID=3046304 RepID=UPI002DB84215|nr:hypothetical protein [Streptomyces sp. H27-D2]MEC4018695.1 hypothetical protein [Streptomyces sp. H27-D2]
MIRISLGGIGVTAAAAALIGARLSRLPMLAYISAVHLNAPPAPGGRAAVWAWPMQPGPQPASWWTAGAAFVVGAALYALRGPRAEGSGSRPGT